MSPDLPIILVSLAAGGAVFTFAWLVIRWLAQLRAGAARLRLPAGRSRSPLLRLLRAPAHVAGVLLGAASARLELRLGRDAGDSFLLTARVRAEKALRAAGRPEDLSAEEFLGLVLVGALLGLAVGGGLYLRLRLGFVPLAAMAVGAVLPLRWLHRCLVRRHQEIRRHLPYALDLLTLSVEAGLDFTEALNRIVRRLGGTALGAELEEMLRQIHLGTTRQAALRDLAARVDLPELRSVAGALVQTDALGGDLAPVLRAQAQQLREMRSQAAEKLAMEAPVKILLPLILFIFPTIFIMIFGPIVLRILLGEM